MRLFSGKWQLTLCLAGLASLASVAYSLPALTAETLVTPADLHAATELAWKLHPQAAALDARDAQVRAAQDLAASLTPEPGSLSLSSRNDRLNQNGGQQEVEVELATPLWLPGQKLARQAEAAAQSDEALARRAALRWEVAGEVREAWWNLAAARNTGALAVRRLDSASALQREVARRHQVGEISRIDANLALTEVNTAQAELIEAEAAQAQAEQAFRLLTGAAAPSGMDEERLSEPKNLPGQSDVALAHPLLAKAASAMSSARARAKVAEQSGRAAPELALRMMRERATGDQPYANSVGIRLKIPFSSGAQVRQQNAAAAAEAMQAEAELFQTNTRIQLNLEQLLRQQAALARQVAIAGQSQQLSAENLSLAEKAFKLGEFDLAALLRIRAAALNADAFLARQRLARATLISRLNQALGVVP
ncbi:MAG: TolC family protein [Undibacterium sp.]|uniref:TolC family protein n=1 Tax=Undibacterium sp. TaxID=1914977 RepID=UPI002716E56F|nr:TolC family protein [Undibacterium sp.]MDO8653104.1 TolC family protein [Undibacterium sp.]